MSEISENYHQSRSFVQLPKSRAKIKPVTKLNAVNHSRFSSSADLKVFFGNNKQEHSSYKFPINFAPVFLINRLEEKHTSDVILPIEDFKIDYGFDNQFDDGLEVDDLDVELVFVTEHIADLFKTLVLAEGGVDVTLSFDNRGLRLIALKVEHGEH
jgi:hypothetical protein